MASLPSQANLTKSFPESFESKISSTKLTFQDVYENHKSFGDMAQILDCCSDNLRVTCRPSHTLRNLLARCISTRQKIGFTGIGTVFSPTIILDHSTGRRLYLSLCIENHSPGTLESSVRTSFENIQWSVCSVLFCKSCHTVLFRHLTVEWMRWHDLQIFFQNFRLKNSEERQDHLSSKKGRSRY